MNFHSHSYLLGNSSSVAKIKTLIKHIVFQILHKGLSSENLMVGSEFYLKLTGVHTDNSNRHKEPAMRLLKRTPSVSMKAQC